MGYCYVVQLIMDKGRMDELNFSKIYIEGVQYFMQFDQYHFDRNSKVR